MSGIRRSIMDDRMSVFSFVDSSADTVVELETLLSSIPALAPESGGDGELAKAEALVGWLKSHGIGLIERFDATDSRVPSGIRPNLVATVPGKAPGKRLWIMSHLDVVPPGEAKLWDSDPYRVVLKDGVLYGRGVEDNQQGLVASTVAALALVRNGIVPPHDLKLLFVADEEVGSAFGIQYLLARHDLFRPDDLIIIPDGGDGEGRDIEVAEKNILWLKLTTKGKQCHGSTPDEGRNAFLAGCDLALRLHDLGKRFGARDSLFEPDYSTFSPTKKEANVPNVNTIPGEDVFYMDMRILPQYPLAAVREEIGLRVAEVEKTHGVSVSTEVVQAVESRRTPTDAPVVTELARALKSARGIEAKPIGIGGGTVGAYLRNAGFDAVVWGTLEETAHQPNEHVKVSNVLADAKIMALVALRAD
jgi:succinyl-diaminopimelate desuccinylase